MQRDIKFEIMLLKHNRDFSKSIIKHYTSLEHLMSGRDVSLYTNLQVVAKRQFTGLKDKNGVEIYEGDILNSTRYIGGNYIDTLTDKVVVSFHNYKWSIQPAKRNLLKPQPITDLEDDCEVIGNIYENPELINS